MLSETVKTWPAQWMAKGLEKGLSQTALRMLAEGIDTELVIKITGLSRERLEELTSDKNRVSEPATDYKPARKAKSAKRPLSKTAK